MNLVVICKLARDMYSTQRDGTKLHSRRPEQRRQLWVQFQEHLKALKAIERQKEEAKTQLIKPITVDEPRRIDGTRQFHRVEWKAVGEATDEILDTQEPGHRISFTLPLPKKEERGSWEPPEGFGYDDDLA